MTKRTKLIIGGLTVAIALAAAVNAATARRFEVSEQRFLVLFRELTFESTGGNVICPVNIEGSFHSKSITKLSGQLIGYITEAIVHHPCQQNNGWALNGIEVIQGITSPNTLPWHILYISFMGTLPNIREIEISLTGAKFRVEVVGVLCLYASESRNWMEGQVLLEGGRVVGLRANEEHRIPLFEDQSGFRLCPPTGVLKGTGTVGTQERWTAITVRLVQ
jgi:hypothetical protein